MKTSPRYLFLLVVQLFFFTILISQNGVKLKHAELLVSEGKYEKAIEKYMKLYKKDSLDYETNLGLGILFEEYVFDEDAALPFLDRAYRLTKKDTQPELVFALAKCQLHNERYNDAIKLFRYALRFVNPDMEGIALKHEIEKYIQNCITGSDYNEKVKSRKYRIKNAGVAINSHNPDYAPVSDTNFSYLLFTSRRPENVGKNKDTYDGKTYEDIFFSEKVNGVFLQAIDLDQPNQIMENYLNSVDHDAIVSISADGKKLFFFQNNSLHLCEWNGTSWSKPQRLPDAINTVNSYEPHATISPDGKIIIFTSDMSGGIGGLDLYISRLQPDGSWGAAENLGSEINTIDDEDGSFLSHDGTELFFSSKGHSGYGGYDIFKSKFDGKKFEKPVNLEPPINSPGDDIHFSFNREQTSGYFASNRKGGYGDMDIYQFFEMDKPAWSACSEKNNSLKGNKAFFSGPDTAWVNELSLFNAETGAFRNEYPYHYFWKVNDSVMPVDSSKFYNYFRKNGNYNISLHVITFSDSSSSRENYCFSKNVYVKERPKEIPVEPILKKEETKLVIQGTADTKKIDTTLLEVFKISLETIYFEVGKATFTKEATAIMDANVNKLKDNKKIVIKITAHTDSRASKDVNLKLSNKRAQAVINYLAKKGIGKDRILAVLNMGEAGLINNCGDDKECNERQHQLNRRVEFKVIGVQATAPPATKKTTTKGTGKKKTTGKKK